ncbi:hypothetical protein B0H13DRAFT_2523488 [Mycena leptocephala]|nr:hypothetical protein B0H13DRAFT_2523488 [Mycena leptocephala]
MVAEKAATLLQWLAEWPTALAHHPTSIVPNYEEFPASSFVIEDLLAMDRHPIHYQELCAQDSTPTDTVSAVLDMLFKSYLMQPWWVFFARMLPQILKTPVQSGNSSA